VNTPEGKKFSTGLQMMYAPFLTRTHRDQLGVYSWMKQLSGVSLFVVWSLEDGIEYGLTEESEGPQPDDKTKRALWDGDEWQTFFDMPSSRLMLLMPGDVAFLKAGAFHRVFTLETKVVAYSNYLDAHTFDEALSSIHRDSAIGEGVSFGHVILLLLEGLKYEASRGGPERAPRLNQLLQFSPDGKNPQEIQLQILGAIAHAPCVELMDEHAEVCKELQGQRLLPRINITSLCARALTVHTNKTVGDADSSSRAGGGGGSTGRGSCGGGGTSAGEKRPHQAMKGPSSQSSGVGPKGKVARN